MWSRHCFPTCRFLCLLIGPWAAFAWLVLHLALRGRPRTWCPCLHRKRPGGWGAQQGSFALKLSLPSPAPEQADAGFSPPGPLTRDRSPDALPHIAAALCTPASGLWDLSFFPPAHFLLVHGTSSFALFISVSPSSFPRRAQGSTGSPSGTRRVLSTRLGGPASGGGRCVLCKATRSIFWALWATQCRFQHLATDRM